MRGNSVGWDSLEIIGALAAGVVLVVAFIAWELRAAEPMVPMRFFRSRAFSAGNAAIFLTLASLFGAVFFFAQMLQTALGYGPLDAGLRLIPWTVTFITVAPVVGNLVDRVGERPFMVAGLSLQAVGMGWIALISDSGLTYSEFLLPSIVAGVGVSMAIPAAQNSVVGSFSVADVGKAAGANSMMRELGGVFGVAVAAAVFAGAGSYASPDAFLDGFAPAVAVLAGFSAVGAIVALALPGRRGPSSPRPSVRCRRSRARARADQNEQTMTPRAVQPGRPSRAPHGRPAAGPRPLRGALRLAAGADRDAGRLLPLPRARRRARGRDRRVPGPRPRWLPYVEVGEIGAATDRARELGASVLLEPREGPAGWRSVVRTAVGGEIAFWQPKAGRPSAREAA